LLFLAMMFVSSAVGAGLVATRVGLPDVTLRDELAVFGQGMLESLATTYGLRMGAVFMISLATIWLRTGLMPRWLVIVTYLVALSLLISGGVTMWVVLAFPLWVLVVSMLLLARAGVIDLHHDGPEEPGR